MAQRAAYHLDTGLTCRLRARTALRGQTPKVEHRSKPEQILAPATPGFWETAQSLQRMTEGRHHTDATLLIRADRDRLGSADGSL